jgi:hypothetical protein
VDKPRYELGAMPRGHGHYLYAVVQDGVVFAEFGDRREDAERTVTALNDVDALRRLAMIGARVAHEWYFDVGRVPATLNTNEEQPNGHIDDGSGRFGFATCPHPDCVLVRTDVPS